MTNKSKHKPRPQQKVTIPRARRKPVRKVILPTSIGVAQKLWNDADNLTRKKMLCYIGASKEQILQLSTRDWLLLSGWVRKRMKGFSKREQLMFQPADTEEAA